MRAIVFAALVACGGAAKPPPKPPEPVVQPEPVAKPPPKPEPVQVAAADDGPGQCADNDDDCAVAALEAFTKGMCRCGAGDTKCAQDEVGKMQVWANKMAEHANNKAPSPDLVKRIEPIVKAYTDCAAKAMTPP